MPSLTPIQRDHISPLHHNCIIRTCRVRYCPDGRSDFRLPNLHNDLYSTRPTRHLFKASHHLRLTTGRGLFAFARRCAFRQHILRIYDLKWRFIDSQHRSHWYLIDICPNSGTRFSSNFPNLFSRILVLSLAPFRRFRRSRESYICSLAKANMILFASTSCYQATGRKEKGNRRRVALRSNSTFDEHL